MVSSTDNDPDFTDDFCGFLQKCVANVDAAELLLLLVQRSRTPSWQAARSRSAQFATATAFRKRTWSAISTSFRGLLPRRSGRGQVRCYRPAASHDPHVAMLARLYVERPVTLFRVIYALRDSKINTFADAFKLRR